MTVKKCKKYGNKVSNKSAKMRNRSLILLAILSIISTISSGYSQTDKWKAYHKSRGINCCAEEGNYLWIGTDDAGVTKFNTITGEKSFFNTCNSGLPNNDVESIAIDSQGVGSIAIDDQGNKWFGYRHLINFGSGLVVFNENGITTPVKHTVFNHSETSGNIKVTRSFPNAGITFPVTKPGRVGLKIFDLKGRIVKHITKSIKDTGNNNIGFIYSDMSNGTYIICLQTVENLFVGKMVIMK